MVATSSLPQLSEPEFKGFRQLLLAESGIQLSDVKRSLVVGRLAKRLAALEIERFKDYLSLIQRDLQERRIAINLLTTNETYFFREPAHFEFLAQHVAPLLKQVRQPRIWCGASSTGEEPYTIAMVLADALGHTRFEVLASDINTTVLDTARRAIYPIADAQSLPKAVRMKHCLKGVGSQEGYFQVSPAIRACVQFEVINLNAPLPALGEFDVIFLRNVMIYFGLETKQKLLQRLVPLLRPGGHFFISHSESLHGVSTALSAVRPSVYVKKVSTP